MRAALAAFLLAAALAQGLVVAGVWLLAGLGWALIVSSVLPFAAVFVLARGLSRGAPG